MADSKNEPVLSLQASADIETHRKSFQASQDGLRYVIVDDFLSKMAFDHLASVFPLEQGVIDVAYDRAVERLKFQAHPTSVCGLDDPVINATMKGDVLQWVKYVTGSDSAYVPDTLPGAGFHETRPPGLLGMHTDNFHLGGIQDPRIYNLIIYLPVKWPEMWGGTLYLGNRKHWKKKGDHRKHQFHRIDPLPNRALLFETSPVSLHGHPDPLECPPDQSRRSLSLWYYVPDGRRPRRLTTFVEEPFSLRLINRFRKLGALIRQKGLK